MSAPDNRLYRFDAFLLDAGSRIQLRESAIVRLTPKAFETLLVLVQNAVQVVEKDRLLSPAGEPCWSADGGRIAFIMLVNNLKARTNIFQIDSAGGNLERLTVGPSQDRRPSLSPDGSKLAFQTNRDGIYEIYVMRLR